jgi:hypothetical protein
MKAVSGLDLHKVILIIISANNSVFYLILIDHCFSSGMTVLFNNKSALRGILPGITTRLIN